MKLTTLLASSAALAALAIVVPASISVNWNLIAPAQASTNISFSLFYDGLRSDGDWVSYDDAYVFVPVNRGRHWRPYTEGHWIYARGYGWTWVSDEPFGWATYHYGRWGYAERIGWYWVPGTRWAPAWVSWRRSGSHVAWAPLPPSRGRGGGDADFTVSFGFDTLPDYYWSAVPTQSFLSINLTTVIINNDNDRRRIVRETEFAGNVKVENNIVVNNVIDVKVIEEKTGEQVKEVEVKKTDDAGSAKGGKGEVTAFTGKVEGEGEAKPEKITKVEDVKKGDQAVEQSGDGAVETDTNAEAQTGKDKKKLKAEQSGEAAVETDTNAEAQTGKDKKKLKTEQSGKAAVETDTNAEVQTGKNKKKLKAGQSADVNAETDTNAEVQTGKDKKKLKAEQSGEAAVETDTNADAQVQTGKKKKKNTETEALSADEQVLEEEPQ